MSIEGRWGGSRDQYNSYAYITMYLCRQLNCLSCLMMSDHEKRDLDKGKWGSWTEK